MVPEASEKSWEGHRKIVLSVFLVPSAEGLGLRA